MRKDLALTTVDVARIALSLPEAQEGSHFGKRDFRVGKRIFSSLPDTRRAVVKLTIEQQEMMTAAEPSIFLPVSGGWGRKGWTSVALENCDHAALTSALDLAWRNVAPKRLVAVAVESRGHRRRDLEPPFAPSNPKRKMA